MSRTDLLGDLISTVITPGQRAASMGEHERSSTRHRRLGQSLGLLLQDWGSWRQRFAQRRRWHKE